MGDSSQSPQYLTRIKITECLDPKNKHKLLKYYLEQRVKVFGVKINTLVLLQFPGSVCANLDRCHGYSLV